MPYQARSVALAAFVLAGTALAQDSTVLRVPGGLGREALGASVTVDGDTLVAGAPGDDTAGFEAGAAFVFVREGSSWPVLAQLTSSDANVGDAFGFAVDVDGTRLVVGAPLADVAGMNSGAVYVFERAGPLWTEVAKLSPADGAMGDRFGFAVQVDGDRIAVGAPRDNGLQTDEGSVYVFHRIGAAWIETQKLTARDAGLRHQFGTSVHLDGDLLAAGAPRAAGAVDNTGSVYVYEALGAAWTLQAEIFTAAGTTGDYFGRSVTGAGDRLVVGAPGDDRGVDGSGTAYVFERAGAVWSELSALNAGTPVQNARLGRSVALLGERVFVGVPDPNRRGRVLEFGGQGAAWSQEATFVTGPGPLPRHRFGEALAVDGITLVVGMPGDDALGTDSGAVHVFDVNDDYPKVAFREATLPDPADMISSAGDEFGRSVSLSGTSALVGAPGAPGGGAAWVFERVGSTWSTPVALVPQQVMGADPRFGTAVDIDGDTALVGAPGAVDPSCTTCPTGGLFVFVRSGTAWVEQEAIYQVGLGNSLDLCGDLAISTTPNSVRTYERAGTSWFQGPTIFNLNSPIRVATDGHRIAVGLPEVFATQPAHVGVYVPTPTSWIEESRIETTPYTTRSLSVEGDRLAIGLPLNFNSRVRVYEELASGTPVRRANFNNPEIRNFGNALCMRGDLMVVGGFNSATIDRAQVFHRTGDDWQAVLELVPPAPVPNDEFGASVSLDGGLALVGMPRQFFQPGMAHVFRVGAPPVTYCTGKTNSLGCVPFLATSGLPSASSPEPFDVLAHDVIPGAPGNLIYAFRPDATDFHGGKLCVKAPFQTLSPATTASALGAAPCIGQLSLDFNAYIQSGADPLLSVGQTAYLQWTQQDAADPAGFGDSLTDGLSLSICP